jgi:hypothetical protein
MSITSEIKIRTLILKTLHTASKQGLTFSTVSTHIDHILAHSGNDKTWYFATVKGGTYSVARSMVTAGLLDKFAFNKPTRILRLTKKGLNLTTKL